MLHRKDFIKSLLPTLTDSTVDLFLLDTPYEIGYNNSKDYNDKKGQINWWLLGNECWRVLKDAGNLIVFAGWSNADRVKSHFLTQGWLLNNRIIWDRQKYQGAKYNFPNSAEDILWFSKSNQRVFNKVESNIKKVTSGFGTKNGRQNRVLTNVWSDISPLVPWGIEYKDGEGYKGQKPVVLLERIINVFTNEGGLVVDGFCGSGSSAIAALRTNREYIMCDISPNAIRITEKRIIKETMKNE